MQTFLARLRSQPLYTMHFTVILWGFTGILGKLIDVHPLQVTYLRTGVAFLFLVGLSVSMKQKPSRLPLRILLQYLGNGVLIGLHWYCFFTSIQVSTLSIAMVCISTSGLFVSLLEPLFTKGRISGSKILASIAICVGVVIIFKFESQYLEGILYGLLTSALGALFTLFNDRYMKRGDSAMQITRFEMLAAALFTWLVAVSWDSDLMWVSVSFEQWIYILLLGGICTGLAFMLSIAVMRTLSAFSVCMAVNLEPIYTIVLGLWIFGDEEFMSPEFYLGGAIVIITVFIHGIMGTPRGKRMWERLTVRKEE